MFLKNYFGREEIKSITKELVGSILEEEIIEIDVDHWITEWELRGKDYTNKILTPVEKIVILELPKFKKYKNKMDQKAIEDAGYDKGYDSGYDSGTLEGKRKEKLEIAKKMKEENMDISTISKITGLTKEEIENL